MILQLLTLCILHSNIAAVLTFLALGGVRGQESPFLEGGIKLLNNSSNLVPHCEVVLLPALGRENAVHHTDLPKFSRKRKNPTLLPIFLASATDYPLKDKSQ